MPNRHDNILHTIGNTPAVRINRLAPDHVQLYVKIEAFNPLSSVKDRLALGIIEAAEKDGSLKPGQTVIEATSGNTGIGLAMVCAQKGYPLVIVMAENFSLERRKLLRFLGAKVVLTPAAAKGSGMKAKARELADKHGWFLARQFDNPANPDIHRRTTAVEIANDFADIGLDYWVSGFGTGGTLAGVAAGLEELLPKTRIAVVEPDNSRMLYSGVPQPDGNNSHPLARPHPIQGWAPDFLPGVVDPKTRERVDEFIAVNAADGIRCARDLATKEGIFVGISSGCTFAGALQLAERAEPGSTILCMLPDTGERYLSTPLFADINVGMNNEERAIAESTNNYRFDQPLDLPPVPIPAASDLSESAVTRFNALVKDNPVMLFSLQWEDFSGAIKRILNHLKVPYMYYDVDALVNNDDSDEGLQLKKVVMHEVNSAVLPVLYLNGEPLLGIKAFSDALADGRLREKLDTLGVNHSWSDIDPKAFFPPWWATA